MGLGLLLEDHPEIQVFLTADDPNYRDPLAVLKGLVVSPRPRENRRSRTSHSSGYGDSQQEPEDAVIIAGKGTDYYQIVQWREEDYQGDAASLNVIYNQTKRR